MPQMIVLQGAQSVIAQVGWPCAGVQSLLLFTLITLVFFKKTAIPRDRKINYFLIGAAGTYLTNVLRISSFFVISLNYGSEAGSVFHNVYGELYFIAWMFLFLMMVIAIQSSMIGRSVRALRQGLRTFVKRKEPQKSS
jgi:thaumarchaeosortase